MQGLVLKSTGNWYEVRAIENNELYYCRLKGKIRTLDIKATNPVAVGDFVEFDEGEPLDGQAQGMITKIQQRKNHIVRKSVNLSKQYQVIAANIDQLVLICTIKNPETTSAFIDRFILTAEAFGIETKLVFNKIDLLNKVEAEILKETIEKYESIKYKCFEISITKSINTEQLKALFHKKTSLIAGNSGVGKSSIVSLLNPDLKVKVGAVSSAHLKGKHTTTFAQMHSIDQHSYIIDTPGIKSFALSDIEKQEVGLYFKEFFKISSDCKFNNCMHLNEPSCAIKKAIEKNTIHPDRYANYLKILEDSEQKYRS